ncbi:MAG: flagellar type III secretion system protein FlhB [Rhodocyclaceae bacterium]|nr:MAG: flagellar type III secretion system protein FlhB [Rhodocyclaceae bacterium]
MAEDSDLERTEPASSRRLEQAREEGQVPQSRELLAFMVLLATVGGMWTMSDWIGKHAETIMRHGLTFDREAAFSSKAMQLSVVTLSGEALLLAAPIFLLSIVGAILAPAMIGGLVFSPKALALNFSRIDPVSGMKRVVSMHGLGELVKAILKSLLIGGVVWWMIRHDGESLFSLLGQPVDEGINSFFHILFKAGMVLLVGVALIVALDVPFQLWQYYSRLRMTKEELKQEHKEQEGDPHLKAKIRAQQREMARNRMMAEVPKADVVVTNPTHFSVALKYDSGAMGAPVVVAKGVNAVALKIRELAAEANVPVLEAPPLARALYRHTEIGDQIPSALYTAVAEVMAYVYQLNQFIADGGRTLIAPVMPKALSVPADLDPGVADA